MPDPIDEIAARIEPLLKTVDDVDDFRALVAAARLATDHACTVATMLNTARYAEVWRRLKNRD